MAYSTTPPLFFLPLLRNGFVPILLDIVPPRMPYSFLTSRFRSDILLVASTPEQPPTFNPAFLTLLAFLCYPILALVLQRVTVTGKA